MVECKTCQGRGFVEVYLKDHSGKAYDPRGRLHTVVCDICHGKGYVTQEDIDDYYRQWELWEIR